MWSLLYQLSGAGDNMSEPRYVPLSSAKLIKFGMVKHQSIPSGHLATAVSVHPVVSCLALDPAWYLWRVSCVAKCGRNVSTNVTWHRRVASSLNLFPFDMCQDFLVCCVFCTGNFHWTSVALTAFQKPRCFLSTLCLRSTPPHRTWHWPDQAELSVGYW